MDLSFITTYGRCSKLEQRLSTQVSVHLRSFLSTLRCALYSAQFARPWNPWALVQVTEIRTELSKIRINEETSMKRTWILCIVGLLAVMVTASSRAQMTGGTEKAVAALEEQWLQSQKTNNPDLVAPLLADKIASTGNDGKVTSKTETLATAKATKYDR